jgi:hypothetical protein
MDGRRRRGGQQRRRRRLGHRPGDGGLELVGLPKLGIAQCMQLIELIGWGRGGRLHCTRDCGGCRACIGPCVCRGAVVSVRSGGRSIGRRLGHRSRALPGPLRRPLTRRLAGRHWCVGRRRRAAARASIRRTATGRSARDGARNGARNGARDGARGAPTGSDETLTGSATHATATPDGGSALRGLELSCDGRTTIGALGHLGALHDDRLGLPRRRPGGARQLLANRRLESLSQLGASQGGAATSTGAAEGSRNRRSRPKFGLGRVAREFRRRLPTKSIGRT